MKRVGVTIRDDGVVEIKRALGTILMDVADFEGCSGTILVGASGSYLRPYVERWNGGAKERTQLGVAILGAREGFVVDHINGNRLDNRRVNLRYATRQQNAWNARAKSEKASRFKGVRLSKSKLRWRACIGVDGKQVGLGSYQSEVDAARAYDAAARKYCGEFAALNFPREGEQGAILAHLERSA